MKNSTQKNRKSWPVSINNSPKHIISKKNQICSKLKGKKYSKNLHGILPCLDIFPNKIAH